MVASGLVAMSAGFNPAFTPSTVLLKSNQMQEVKAGMGQGGGTAESTALALP